MPVIKLQVSIPEAVRTIELFKANRKKALVNFTKEISNSVSNIVNQILQTEIDIFLGKPEQTDNKRNGYHPEREYVLKGIGCIRIRQPKDRKGRFESAVIPSYERSDPRLKADMAILHLAGLSTRTLSMISRRLLGMEVSKDNITNTLDLVKEEAISWLTREIKENYWALYIDGTNFKIQRRGSTEKEPSLVVLGISASNHKSIIAIEPGTRDDVKAWRTVFHSLKERGFNSTCVRIGIMDGLPGLEALFKEEFPQAVTQRCWVHALRNALAKSPARLQEAFKKLALKVMYAQSFEGAKEAFRVLKETMGNDAERAVKCLEKDIDSLIEHYRFDKRYWISLKTTNSIERINKEFKRRTKSMGTIGESTLQAMLAFIALRIEMGWLLNPVDSKAIDNLLLPNSSEKNVIEKSLDKIGLLN